jgi:superfamily I DNA/RNA helicase
MPFPKATAEWQIEQERNLQYVAWTRALDQLYFVQ